jgi:hypothetical protein
MSVTRSNGTWRNGSESGQKLGRATVKRWLTLLLLLLVLQLLL